MPRFSPAALLLDMDGLMVDSEPLWFEVERTFVHERIGDRWTEAHWRACIGKGTHNTLVVMEGLGVPIDYGRDDEVIFQLFIDRVPVLKAKPGLFELLDAARGKVALALASSSPATLVAAVLQNFAIRERFDAVVTGSNVVHHKPAPDVFLEAARRLGVAPADCLVLEDSLPGATAGRTAGARVIAVPEGSPEGRGYEAVADAIVPDLFAAAALIDFSSSSRGLPPSG